MYGGRWNANFHLEAEMPLTTVPLDLRKQSLLSCESGARYPAGESAVAVQAMNRSKGLVEVDTADL